MAAGRQMLEPCSNFFPGLSEPGIGALSKILGSAQGYSNGFDLSRQQVRHTVLIEIGGGRKIAA